MDLFENDGRGAQGQASAAIDLGDQDGKITRIGQRFDEGVGVGAARVKIAPVFTRKILADAPYAFADLGVILAERNGYPGDVDFFFAH